MPLDETTSARIQWAAAEALNLEELTTTAVPLLAAALDAPVAVTYRITRDQGMQARVACGPRDVLGDYLSRSQTEPGFDPLIELKQRLDLKAGITTQLVDRRAFRRSAAFGDVYSPAKLVDALVLRISRLGYADPAGATAVVLFRLTGQPSWETRDLTAAKRLMPVFEGTMRREARLSELDLANRTLSALVSVLAPDVAAVVDFRGHVRWCSERGARVLAPWLRDPPPELLSRLGALERAWRERGATDGDATHVHFSDGRDVLVCDLVLSHAESGEEPLVLLRVGDVFSQGSSLARAKEALQLTPREASVCGLLLSGMSSQQIAETLFISRGTLRAHVQNILKKTGCHSRLEIVAKLRGFTEGT